MAMKHVKKMNHQQNKNNSFIKVTKDNTT